MKKSVSFLLAFCAGSLFAQVPALPASIPSAGDAAYVAARDAFNKVVRDIPFSHGSAELRLNDPQYSVAGINIDAFMKQTLIPALSKLVNVLPAGKKVVLTGYASRTGSEEASGSFVGNIALSRQRAEAVKAYILANSSIDGSRLSIVAEGSSRTISGIDPKNVKNCRVTLKAE